MKKGVYILFVFLLLIASCQKKNPFAEYPEWILGEWVASEPYSDIQEWGFYFISKDSCEIRPGYISNRFKRPNIYLGNTTAYQLKNDTLNLFDLQKGYWKECTIKFLSPDTMEITYRENSYKTTIKYTKPTYSISNENLFDQIIIDEDESEFKILSIDRLGKLFYLGSLKSLFEGLHTSEEGKRAFKQVELLFREANSQIRFIDKFPQKLDTRETWGASTITFVKNHKMATIIGPALAWRSCVDFLYDEKEYFTAEFKWACEQSLFLEQQMPVQLFDASKYVLDSTFYNQDIPGFVFENNNKQIVSLYRSEYFYLWTQLLSAKKVEVDFTPVYRVIGVKNKYIQSDGRYYRYQTDKGETVTLDLGFNFIEENELGDKFEDRRKFIPK
jgi:hypothetical protein